MKKEFRKFRKKLKDILLANILPDRFYFSHAGHCPCCEEDVVFESYNNWLRDYFLCENCGCLPRERALMVVLEKYYPEWRELHIHESSPVKRGASIRLMNNCKYYVPSQYYPSANFGELVGGHINENLEDQTFPDASFDLVVTQDVMEHIYRPEKAFYEIARTLKKGGAHIFTVPVINRHYPTEVWATEKDGKPVFLKTPEYHGNPVDPEGSPVTMHWGFDMVDFIRDCSGLETSVEYIDNLDLGIRAEYIEVFVSKKN